MISSAIKHLVLIFALLIAGAVVTHAQVFPIQVTPQVLPPYTPVISAYTAPGAQRFLVQLRNNDLNFDDHQIKLRITIEGVGITIRTRANFVPQPLTLPGGGIPTIFYGEDIAEYFLADNLDFAGYSKREYQNTGKLPEGVYRISLEVLDYNRGILLSNKGTTVVWMILNDPPLLSLPRNDSKVQILNPQNIPFSWTPRHTASPNSAFSTEYIFRLVEIWPANRNPYDAFLSQPPLYEVTTSQSQILYGPGEPALIPGRKYAWQVQAVDTEGQDLFKNNGRSEVRVFQFGDELGVPENFRKELANTVTLSLRWESPMEGELPGQYRIRYKTAGRSTWQETVTLQSWTTLTNLQPNTEYEVQVRAERETRFGEYTVTQRFSTAEIVVNTEFSCGRPPQIIQTSAGELLLALSPGDVFTCNDFSVVVTEIENGSNGNYKGKGLMQVKMLNGASIGVTFAGTLNNKYEMTAGGVRSIYQQGSPMGQVIEQMNTIGEEKPEQQQPKDEEVDLSKAITVIVPGEVDSVVVGSDGKIEVVAEDGTVTAYEQKKDEATGKPVATVIQDASGDQWLVKKDETTGETKVTKVEGGGLVTGGGASVVAQPSNASPQERKLVKEILNRFRNQIASALTPAREPVFPRGAGPIASGAFSPAPGCMPEDEDQLKAVDLYLAKVTTDDAMLDAFISNVYKNQNDKQAIVEIAASATVAENQKYSDVLSTENLQRSEQTLCSHAVEQTQSYVALIWWNAPYWERAAKILKEHFEDTGLYEDVVVECTDNSCKTIGVIKIAEGVSASVEVTFDAQRDPSETWAVLSANGVDFWEGRTVTLETFKERFWNYMAMKDDHLYQGKGWESATLRVFADVLMAAPGTVEGWVTGKHWRTGEELAMWEHILGVLDIIPAETLAKAGITALVIKVGGRLIDLTKLTQPVKHFILTAYQSGLKLMVKSKDEIVVFASNGTQQIGRLLNGVIQDLYWVYGGERILARLAGVKYMADPVSGKIVEGTLDIVDDAGTVGARVTREAGKVIYLTTKINGATVVRILGGTNGKVALIGRKMSYIQEVAEALKKMGKEVEIFDVSKAFGGQGYKDWTSIKADWDDALRQFGVLDNHGNKVLPYEKVKKTLWYKENERWAKWIKESGFDIYDLGDNPGSLFNAPDRSAFYDLEKVTIFND